MIAKEIQRDQLWQAVHAYIMLRPELPSGFITNAVMAYMKVYLFPLTRMTTGFPDYLWKTKLSGNLNPYLSHSGKNF
jgi:hypothetical protein